MAVTAVQIIGPHDGTAFDPMDVFGHHPQTDALASDEHPSASHGLPVVLVDGRPHGPADLTGATLYVQEADMDMAARLEAAGYAVRVALPTADTLSVAEAQQREGIA